MPLRTAKIRALHDVPRKARPDKLPNRPKALRRFNIAPISLRAYAAYVRRKYRLFTIALEDIEAALTKAKEKDPAEVLPEEFKDFADLFSPKEAERLPPHRPYDHNIRLQEGKTPPFRPLYPISRNELKALRD